VSALHGVDSHFVFSPPPTPTRSGSPVSLRMGMGDSELAARRGDALGPPPPVVIVRDHPLGPHVTYLGIVKFANRAALERGATSASRTCCRSFRTSSIRSVRSGVICRFFCLVFETWNACPIARPPTSENPFASIKLKAGPASVRRATQELPIATFSR